MGMAAGEWCRGRTLGRGSSATVSLAVAALSGDLFAVKSAALSRAAPLHREQGILSGLSSPYIISCLGFDVADTGADGEPQFNLFLEYAPGGSLSDEIKRRGGRLDERAVRSRALEILRGLAYLHGAGIAHCDVKGQNVLIGSEGCAKIADFGCARRVGGDAGSGQFSGTPAYMAPEVARGEEQGTRADVWALGCTVVEMAAGRAPWPEFSDPVAALHHIGFSERVPEIPLWLSEEGQDFVRKCLRRDPTERWTAEQLLRHPFVAPAAAANCAPIRCHQDRFWVSPKSTLDQGFWESESEEDEPADKFAVEDPSRRIRMLAELSVPDWKWDDDWITVRSNGGGDQTGPTVEEEEEEEGPTPDFCGRSGVVSSSVGSGGDGDFVFSTGHMGSEDSHYSSHGYGIINESSRGEIGNLVEGIGVNSVEQRSISCEREIIISLWNCNNDTNSVKQSKAYCLTTLFGIFTLHRYFFNYRAQLPNFAFVWSSSLIDLALFVRSLIRGLGKSGYKLGERTRSFHGLATVELIVRATLASLCLIFKTAYLINLIVNNNYKLFN